MRPFLAWRCVGWSDQTLNFFVVPCPGSVQRDMSDGWVVDGADALVEIAAQLSPGDYSVHLVARREKDDALTFCRVTALWRRSSKERMGRPSYWYSTDDGQTRACSPVDSALQIKMPELEAVLNFDAC